MNSTGVRHPIYSLLGFLTVSFGAGFIGTQGTLRGLGGWYQVLEKPSWNPPAWVFAPVWTVLYVFIGLAGWLVWRGDGSPKKIALWVYGFQLSLNALWPWLFFAFHLLFWSTVEIGILWILIGLTILLFSRTQKLAAALLLPYVLWVLFAASLNFSIWRINQSPGSVQVLESEGQK